MKQQNATAERDREATEKRLINSIAEIIREDGFEKIGINAVAARSGVSKILIYRYFGSVEGLMAAYIRQHDFWINQPLELPTDGQIIPYIKKMFSNQIEHLRNNPTLKRLYRWELSTDNQMITKLREQREEAGMERIRQVCAATGYPQKDIAVMASLVTASVTYLAMLGEFCPVYNGISINSNHGWEQITDGINTMIDKIFATPQSKK